MVEVKNDFGISATELLCILDSTLCHITEKSLVSILTSTARYLKDNGRFCLNGSHYDCLQLLHVVEVESGDSVAAFHCSCKHITCVYKAKFFKIYHSFIYFKSN